MYSRQLATVHLRLLPLPQSSIMLQLHPEQIAQRLDQLTELSVELGRGAVVEHNTVRRRGLTVIAALVAVGGLAWGGWHWTNARHFETTDNAYAAGNVAQITPQVGGTVVAIGANDTDFVRAGQVLVTLDAADARGHRALHSRQHRADGAAACA